MSKKDTWDGGNTDAKTNKDELVRAKKQREELSQQVSQLEREVVANLDEMHKANDDLAGVQVS